MKFVNKYENGGEVTKKPLIKKKSYKELSLKEKMEVDMKDEKNGKSVSGAGTVSPTKKPLIKKK